MVQRSVSEETHAWFEPVALEVLEAVEACPGNEVECLLQRFSESNELPEKGQFRGVRDVHQPLLGFVKASVLYDGIDVVVRARSDVPPPQAKKKQEFQVNEDSSGLPLVSG